MATRALISIPHRDDDRGLDFVRAAIALARGNGRMVDTIAHAERAWGASSRPAMILRAVTGTSTPDSPGWGSELVADAATEFFALVKTRAVLGRLNGIRRVPMRTRILSQVGAAQASWTGEAEAKPFTEMAFAEDSLQALKIICQTVVTDEMLRFSGPGSETMIRNDLVSSAVAELDATFLDSANAGQAGVTPAAITYNAPTVPYSGTFGSSFANMIDAFTGDLSGAYLVADPVFLASLPIDAFPDVGARGGEIKGIPVLAADALPKTDSPQLHELVLIDPAGLALAEEEARIEVARHATVALIDESNGEGALVSLWQRNLVAILCEKYINWRRARAGSVLRLTGIPRGVSA